LGRPLGLEEQLISVEGVLLQTAIQNEDEAIGIIDDEEARGGYHTRFGASLAVVTPNAPLV
jgi:hypothetical protein